ncbi:MAG: glutamate synthase subunit beta [Spirochaetales bacterium]|nr:glutamate synthase subunit beta [Spirochaetales bacterium]
MGKATGFLDYQRKNNESVPPSERVLGFKEFHTPLDENERRCQAARCMDCGVPMCQSAIQLKGMVTGCPLHNYIPEWNDALYKGQFDMATWRLLKTSSFPEFTGRVCPALCEKACNLGNGDTDESVTIHDNELFIIEKAFESGYMKPQVPKTRSGKKVAVVGAGPSGLAVADWLNRRGHSVTVYEREDRPGGLLMYGIPNMKLDKSVIDRRVELMQAEGVEFVMNADIRTKEDADRLTADYDAVALCCGAKKARPLSAKGATLSTMDAATGSECGILVGGIMFAVDWLKSVTKSLLSSNLQDGTFITAKDKHVVILGGGDTGNDCTGTAIRLGCKSVTQLEMMPCPPTDRAKNNPWPEWPKVLKVDYGAQESINRFGSDPRVYKTTIKEVHSDNGQITGITTVEVEFREVDGTRKLCEIEGSEKELPCDLLLIAAGFLGAEDYTMQSFGVDISPRNTVLTPNPKIYRTSREKVFTAGDMHRGQSLVVWAIAEGRECARQIDAYLTGYTYE